MNLFLGITLITVIEVAELVRGVKRGTSTASDNPNTYNSILNLHPLKSKPRNSYPQVRGVVSRKRGHVPSPPSSITSDGIVARVARSFTPFSIGGRE